MYHRRTAATDHHACSERARGQRGSWTTRATLTPVEHYLVERFSCHSVDLLPRGRNRTRQQPTVRRESTTKCLHVVIFMASIQSFLKQVRDFDTMCTRSPLLYVYEASTDILLGIPTNNYSLARPGTGTIVYLKNTHAPICLTITRTPSNLPCRARRTSHCDTTFAYHVCTIRFSSICARKKRSASKHGPSPTGFRSSSTTLPCHSPNTTT